MGSEEPRFWGSLEPEFLNAKVPSIGKGVRGPKRKLHGCGFWKGPRLRGIAPSLGEPSQQGRGMLSQQANLFSRVDMEEKPAWMK